MLWFLRQQCWRHTLMFFLINKAALLSFQIWLKLARGVQLPENTCSKKTAEAYCLNHRRENLAKTDCFGLLTSKVLMNTMNWGRCMICFEHFHCDWWSRFGKWVPSQWRWKLHCLASFNILVEAGFTLTGQCTNKSLIICSIMNLLATLWINAVHNIPESKWALN